MRRRGSRPVFAQLYRGHPAHHLADLRQLAYESNPAVKGRPVIAETSRLSMLLRLADRLQQLHAHTTAVRQRAVLEIGMATHHAAPPEQTHTHTHAHESTTTLHCTHTHTHIHRECSCCAPALSPCAVCLMVLGGPGRRGPVQDEALVHAAIIGCPPDERP